MEFRAAYVAVASRRAIGSSRLEPIQSRFFSEFFSKSEAGLGFRSQFAPGSIGSSVNGSHAVPFSSIRNTNGIRPADDGNGNGPAEPGRVHVAHSHHNPPTGSAGDPHRGHRTV